VEFVRFVGDEVVRDEQMKVDGEKVVRTEKEIDLQKEHPTEAKAGEQGRPANAPSLKRPGESTQDVNPMGIPSMGPVDTPQTKPKQQPGPQVPRPQPGDTNPTGDQSPTSPPDAVPN
jgi:hypothetical protein